MEISSTSSSSDEGEVQEPIQGSNIEHQQQQQQQQQPELDQNQSQEQFSEQPSGQLMSQSPGTNKSRSRDEADLTEVRASDVSNLEFASKGSKFDGPYHTQEAIKEEESGSSLMTQVPKPDGGDANKGAVFEEPIMLDDDEDDYEPPESITPVSPVDNDTMSVDSFSPPPPNIPLKEVPQPAQDSAIQTVSEKGPADNEAVLDTENLQQFETVAPDVQEVRSTFALFSLSNLPTGTA